jgi:hypothetical protein
LKVKETPTAGEEKMTTQGRPPEYTDKTRVQICATGKTKLQHNSDRKAIITLMVDNGGVMTLKAIDDHFGFNIRPKVVALIHAGWLGVVHGTGTKGRVKA